MGRDQTCSQVAQNLFLLERDQDRKTERIRKEGAGLSEGSGSSVREGRVDVGGQKKGSWV